MNLTVNISMTADGRITLPGRRKLDRIGNDYDMQRLKSLRERSDAIMVGSGTVIADNVALRVGKEALRELNNLKYPLRVCILGNRLPYKDSNIFDPQLGGSTIIFCCQENSDETASYYSGFTVIGKGQNSKVDLRGAVDILGNDFQVDNLVVEGGASIIGSLLAVDLIDRCHITLCPYFFGGETSEIMTPVKGWGVIDKEDRRFNLRCIEQDGDWLFLEYVRERGLKI